MQRRILIPAQLAGLPLRLPKGEIKQASGLAMGTSWTVKWVDEGHASAESVVARITASLELVIAEMSTWQADSWLSRFNIAPAGSWHTLPQHVARVLDCALAIASSSKGAFDPTIGPLVNLWGFGPGATRLTPPDPGEIAAIQALCGWWRVERDGDQLRQPGGLYLDFSGIAKGYSVDLIAAHLRQLGIVNFLVEVGGELYGNGLKPDGLPWWVALEAPAPATVGAQSATYAQTINMPPTIAALHGLAMATSGDYHRYFESAGIRYAHTLDPRTGRPVQHAAHAVTVLHASCMQADALATALTVLGVQAGLAYAERYQVAALFTLSEQGQAVQYCTQALQAMDEEAAV